MNKLIPTFKATIKEGKLIFDNRENFDAFVRTLDGRVFVTIEKEGRNRTLNQNNYLWFIYTLISDTTGFTPQEVHDICKAKFLKKTKVFNDKVYESVGSTAVLDIGDFFDYTENIVRWATTEFGIVFPEGDFGR